MYSASIRLSLGEKSSDYMSLLDKLAKHKRSSVLIKKSKDAILIDVKADDPIALIASINGVLKQIRIIGNADKLFEY
ncbi:MAG: hypothetical protein KGH61_01790 [Candidatus Micrarchaeota archaeon]|nr:hypothetical protein [Candidatus Micrarchaeota archaeon]MDE1847662.1 hypothetical protein [Candidatus Micrarchaeota archaeon]MDE1864483.1 hypothetical protein [Candidatus Micrarchaeota archaeon]